MPELTEAAWANRGFHQRAARWMAGEQGIRQFVDIGSGLPTAGNTHEVVHAADPGARVVYVDSDPMVELHSRALLEGQAAVTVICADLRDPDQLLGHPALRAIDFSRPVGLLMSAVMHFVAPASQPYELVRRYTDALAPGSCLGLSHVTDDETRPAVIAAIHEVYANATEQMYFRSQRDVGRFFDGLELVPPGVVTTAAWRAAGTESIGSEGSRILWGGVGRRP